MSMENEKRKKIKLIHIKSKQRAKDNESPKLPTSDQLEYGEIAINFGKDIETIAIRNENDEIVKFIPENKVREYIQRAINSAIPEIVEKIEERFDNSGISDGDFESIDSGEY